MYSHSHKEGSHFVAGPTRGGGHHARAAQMIGKVVVHAAGIRIRLSDAPPGEKHVLIVTRIRRAPAPIRQRNKDAAPGSSGVRYRKRPERWKKIRGVPC